MRRLTWMLLPLLAAPACLKLDRATDTADASDVEGTGDAAPGDTTADVEASGDTGGAIDGSGADTTTDAGPTLDESDPVDEAGNYVVRDCSTVGATTRPYVPQTCQHEVARLMGTVDRVMSCGAGSDTPKAIRLNYPTEDASRTLAFMWTSGKDNRSTLVQLGTSPDNLDRTYWGYSFTYSGLVNRRQHEVHVCDLEPGRTYHYRVGGEGGWSEIHTFSTAPAPGTEGAEVVFGVVGDTRSSTYEAWGQAIRQIRDAGADFVLFSGDAVEVGPVQAQWDLWFEQASPALADLPYVPCNGNHDQVVLQYFAQFALPRDERNYAVRYGDMAIVSMTDTPIDEIIEIGGSYRAFMDDAYTRLSDARWKVLLNHRPFYSASTRHGSAEDLQAEWLPVVDEHRVDIVFNGHDHNYERSRPVRGGEVVAPGAGTLFVVAAGVGAPLYDNGADWWTEKSEKVENYLLVRATRDTMQVTAYRLDGTVLDEFSLQK